jgi:type II secretory pathway component PulK
MASKYQNSYSPEIWPIKEREFSLKAKSFRQATSRKAQFISELMAAGISRNAAEYLANSAYDWEELEASGRIVWSDDAKRTSAYAAQERYFDDAAERMADYDEKVTTLYQQNDCQKSS